MSQGKFEDLTGCTYGKLTVLCRAPDYVQPSGQHKRMWHCKCQCGKECDVRASDLKSGNTQSCGCFQQYSRGKSTFIDYSNKKIGKLRVLYRLPDHVTPSGQKKRKWHCVCDCGNECDVYSSQLKSGKDSCGCSSKDARIRRRAKKEMSKNRRSSASIKRIIPGENDLVTTNPELLSDWSFEKNTISPEQISASSSAIVWWKCPNGHDYDMKIRLRAGKEKCGCPYCSIPAKRVLKGFNDLQTKYPNIAKEWHPTLNGDLSPDNILCGSGKMVWWKCIQGHEYEQRVSHRIKGSSCPYCCNQKTLVGVNDLASTNPELLKEWDYEKNNRNPTQVRGGSSKKVWWRCSLGHSYEMSVGNRTRQKCGCPYCSVPAKRVLKGFNDLQTKYPDIAKEWHPTKNGDLTPDEVLCGTARVVWWLGECGHEYSQKIVVRVKGAGCPYCSHQRLLEGFSDLATTNPEILSEWDYDANDVLPTEIGVGTHKKIWWKCPFGHKYQAYPSNRCGSVHSGCPICDKENHTSFPEQALFYYIKKYFPDAVNSDRTTIGMELDVYIPSLRIAIEYDGRNWHKNITYELKKNKACKEAGILLMRIREEGLESYDDCYCIIRNDVRKDESLSEVISQALYDINKIVDTDIDVSRDASAIYGSYIKTRKLQSLQSVYPEIASEWHPSFNGELTPEMVAPLTNKKVWWIGKCGHEWQMSVQDRTNQNCGCPICSGKRVVSGINDLLSTYPVVCEEWDYEKNNANGIFPNEVAPHSDKKVYWKCAKCGFSWFSKIDSRTRMKTGCPECGKRTISESKYKPVECIETGIRYKCLKEAEAQTGIHRSSISQCCKGRVKSAGGFHWKYI